MFISDLFDVKSSPPKGKFVWEDFEDLPMEARLSLAEAWLSGSSSTLLESNDPTNNNYFLNMVSDSPKLGKKYIVTLLALVNNRVVVLHQPEIGKVIKKISDAFTIEFSPEKSVNFPYDSVKNETTVKTFFFKNTSTFNEFRSQLKMKFDTDIQPSKSSVNEATKLSTKERILRPGVKVGDTVLVKAPGYEYVVRTAKFLRIGPSGLATVKLSAPLGDNSNVPDYFKGATTLAVPPSWLHSDVDSAWPKPEWLKRKEQQQESLHYVSLSGNQVTEYCKNLGRSLKESGVTHWRDYDWRGLKYHCANVITESQHPAFQNSKQFVDRFKSLDQFSNLKIQVGSKVAILMLTMSFDRAELSGFKTPKTITKIYREPTENNITQFEFNNDPDDVWPRQELASYSGEFIIHSCFFGSSTDLEHAITMLLVGAGPDLTVSVDLQESKNKMKSSEFIQEAKGLKKKVRIVKGPKEAVGKVGYIGEVRHGMFKGAPKTYTVDYDDGTGNITSIQLPASSLRLVKTEEMTESKAPTAKQVEAAKEKYELYGLKIENAKKKAGYARGTGTVGDSQRKKGEAYTKYLELKKAFDSNQK